jgi:hypothetical protein
MASTVVGVLLAGLLSAPVEPQGQPAGYVKIVTGTAAIIRGGTEMAARPGDAVYQSDGLRTGADGRLGVTLKDETRVSLGPSSEIALDEFEFSPAEGRLALVMKVLRGAAAFVTGRIANLQPDAMRVETPASIIGIRGTHLAVRVEAPGGPGKPGKP